LQNPKKIELLYQFLFWPGNSFKKNKIGNFQFHQLENNFENLYKKNGNFQKSITPWKKINRDFREIFKFLNLRFGQMVRWGLKCYETDFCLWYCRCSGCGPQSIFGSDISGYSVNKKQKSPIRFRLPFLLKSFLLDGNLKFWIFLLDGKKSFYFRV